MQPATHKIIEAITSPLGFFVLALLIVEAFLATVLLGAEFQEQFKVAGMYVGVGMFLVVLVIVTVLVWNKPDHLTFKAEDILRDRNKPPFGTESHIAPESEKSDRKETENTKNV